MFLEQNPEEHGWTEAGRRGMEGDQVEEVSRSQIRRLRQGWAFLGGGEVGGGIVTYTGNNLHLPCRAIAWILFINLSLPGVRSFQNGVCVCVGGHI